MMFILYFLANFQKKVENIFILDFGPQFLLEKMIWQYSPLGRTFLSESEEWGGRGNTVNVWKKIFYRFSKEDKIWDRTWSQKNMKLSASSKKKKKSEVRNVKIFFPAFPKIAHSSYLKWNLTSDFSKKNLTPPYNFGPCPILNFALIP